MPSGHDSAAPSNRRYASKGLSPTSRMRMPPTMNAAITAMSGKRSSRASLVTWLMASRHQQPDFFQRGNLRINFTGNLPLMNNQQTIREPRHFFKLRRDEQDRTTLIAQGHELTMNKLDRT